MYVCLLADCTPEPWECSHIAGGKFGKKNYNWIWQEGKVELQCALLCRKRNGINSRSKLEIVVADGDFYFAKVDQKLAVKLGPRYDMGDLAPREDDGWKIAASGRNYAVWEKQ